MAGLPAPGSGAAKSALATKGLSLLPGLLHTGAMRFEVTIDHWHHLGSWTQCSGLSVKFDNRYQRVDGQLKLVPGGLKEPDKVSLRRPLTEKGAKAIEEWLESYHKHPRKVTAHVRLLNTYGGKVASWTLRNVAPHEWKIDDFKADSNQLAYEKLELSHEGLLSDHDAGGARFKVTIDGVGSLGEWTVCDNLQVEVKTKNMPYGGSGQSIQIPDYPEYHVIKLQRPFTDKGWQAVRKWLVDQFEEPLHERTATITVRSFDDLKDHCPTSETKWTLHDATPGKWFVSDLKAGSTLEPTETLEIHHSGFLESTTKERTRAKLSGGGTVLEFYGDPTDVHLSCSQSFRTWKRAVPTRKSDQAGPASNEFVGREVSTLDVTVPLYRGSGKKTVDEQIRSLKSWGGQVIGAQRSAAPEKLTFTWGQLRFEGYISRLSISQETMRRGKLFWAVAKIEMREEPPKPSGTNPTSGGTPGRKAVTVAAGDSLESLAFREYGEAAAWRAVAVANGIEDPARVAPGTRLVLPPDV